MMNGISYPTPVAIAPPSVPLSVPVGVQAAVGAWVVNRLPWRLGISPSSTECNVCAQSKVGPIIGYRVFIRARWSTRTSVVFVSWPKFFFIADANHHATLSPHPGFGRLRTMLSHGRCYAPFFRCFCSAPRTQASSVLWRSRRKVLKKLLPRAKRRGRIFQSELLIDHV